LDEFCDSEEYQRPSDPLGSILKMYNELGKLAEIMLPQVQYQRRPQTNYRIPNRRSEI